jgi:hypothetical protein
MCKNLQGKKLTVVSIHRKGIFDMDAMAFICENCGRVIVNSAIVKDETNKTYVIGLDCKKTLIDNPIINIHGYYWKEQKSYLCRFTDNPKKLLCNGAAILQGYEVKKNVIYVSKNAQYINYKYIKPIN